MTREEMLAVAKPILFNTEMVRAILDNRKTATRRAVKPQPAGDGSKPEPLTTRPGYWNTWGDDNVYRQPYRPGDILYVRETFCMWNLPGLGMKYCYKATDPNGNRRPTGPNSDDEWEIRPWHPSIHMPKEAARIFLRVTDVRVERLQEIMEEQAKAEGMPDALDYPISEVYCPVCRGYGFVGAYNPDTLGFYDQECPHCDTQRKRFSNFWDSTIKPADRSLYGWDANPWVWCYEFKKMEAEQ